MKRLIELYWRMRIYFYARRVARHVLPELRQSACKKFGTRYIKFERTVYVEVRAAQLAQPLVDDILRENPAMPAVLGNKLITSACGRAAILASKTARRHSLVAA
jgi:hypothetical protein